MAETFYGPWSLLILSKDAAFAERVTISGSANSDGSFPGTPGFSIAEINGDTWSVELEWSSDSGATWHESAVLRTLEVTPADGLVVTLGADDNLPHLRDNDFNDLVILLKYLDPNANPPGPKNPFDFTIPREWLKQGKDPADRQARPPASRP